MRKVIFLFLLLQYCTFYGQQFVISQRFPAPRFHREIKDKSDLVVLYEITFTDGKGKQLKTQTLLQIGSKLSKFLDVNTIGRDSLIEVHSKSETVGAKELNELGKFNVTYKKSVLKDYLTQSFIYQKRLSKNIYRYSEPMPKYGG